VVEQAGSLAGFAAVIGLAVLSALYFSQARDLRRLREWAGRAPERAAEMGAAGQQSPIPGRVVAVPQRQAQPGAPAAKPAVPGATPAVPGAKPATEAASNGDAAPAVAATKPGDGEGEPADGGAEKKDGDEAKPAEAKPGMPAPASAAAAAASAGAGAKSVAGPAAPTGSPAGAQPGSPVAQAGSAPSASAPAASPPETEKESEAAAPAKPDAPAGAAGRATPQRTPGSVLPPRTGTLPPVRRLPSAQTGPSPAQTGVLGPTPQKRKRNPMYVALAIIGVLVLGAAAAVGVPAIVNGAKDDKTTSSKSASKTTKQSTKKKAAATTTPSKITVAVLNGTSIPGLAAQIGDRVDADGFTLGTVSNASPTQGQRANSVAMYASGHESEARLVARKLGIRNVARVDASSQQIAGDATVVVIVGSDKTQ
jgi:hypothetical protein